MNVELAVLLNAPPIVMFDLLVAPSATTPMLTVESVDDVCTFNVVSVDDVPTFIV